MLPLHSGFRNKLGELDQNSSSLRVDAHHFNKLLESAENLIELDIPMETCSETG